MEQIVTQRLHISGLTPAISQSDLSQRLSSFGTVLSLDGFGKVDGVGRPRRFGYVTFQASKSQLTRCMNLLSGTTWKGTKLRIGEAKPDFRERISREIGDTETERPRNRRRLARGVRGVHAADMSLVTPENVRMRKGWLVTPLGRLIRPMRMRPLKPLPYPDAHSIRKNDRDPQKKSKQRFKRALTRARRQTINPIKWRSQHLKGAFLDSVFIAKDTDVATSPPEIEQEGESDNTSSVEENLQIVSAHSGAMASPTTAKTQLEDADSDLTKEKMHSLSLLNSMFGGLDKNEDWRGREKFDSDIEMEDNIRPTQEADVHLEQEMTTKEAEPLHAKKNTLKDLFAPHEEQAFSLLSHLELDLDLEDEPILPVAPNISLDSSTATQYHAVSTTTHSRPTFTMDPKQPLFFPCLQESRNNVPKDIMTVMRDRGFDWEEGFYRRESSEDIKRRWEETKIDLTRDWKRRHREAVKNRRRRGGNWDGDL